MNRFLPHQMGRCNVMLLPLTNNFTVFPKVPRGGRLQCLEEHQTSNNTNEGHHCDKLIMDFFVIYKLTEPLCEEIWLSDLKIDHCVFQKIRCSADQLSFPGSWNESINAVILQFGHKAYSSPKVGFLTVHLTRSNNKPAGTPKIEPAAAGCQARKLSIVLFPVTG